MNLRQFVGPDGTVELQMPDKSIVRRWPIDAKEMIAKGGARIVGAPAAKAEAGGEHAVTSKPESKAAPAAKAEASK